MVQNNNFFDNLEKKTNVKQQDIFNLANSVNGANFQDEQTVRNLIQQVSKLANKPVPKEKEDELVKTIVNNNMPLDFASLAKMFGKK
uniref:Sporulation protein n=1 Tax=Anaerobacillus isosaccharinicus TaxID=1532552 RepID=A0A1S2KVW9_9BACI|nr:stage VI sporulation protein F [Anaerobacillus isosaccharinicus]MBA5585843.1 stage VI sporulation protein F [Anaerobacillus isosaccharinicus]QOY38764.1 stage VI sporulation protein F [Anaerobacillus isosaccharinicus]